MFKSDRRRQDVEAACCSATTKTGAIDISIDPNNPNVHVRRDVGGVPQGIPDVERRPGQRPVQVDRRRRDVDGDHAQPGAAGRASIGRIGVAVSAANPNRVYALVENDNGGLFSSDDAGATWTLVNANRNIRQRAFYYTHVFADPKNADVVYLQNTAPSARRTAARRCDERSATDTHGDFHDLWIDPDDSDAHGRRQRRRRRGDDERPARARGRRRTSRRAQFYHVVATTHMPFHVCGSQQDNSTLCMPYNWNLRVGGGGDAAAAADAAACTRRRHRTVRRRLGERLHRARPARPRPVLLGHEQRRRLPRQVQPPHRAVARGEPVSAHVLRARSRRYIKERWQWTYPIIFSQVEPARAVRLVAAPVADDGRRPDSWERSAATSRATTRRRWGSPAARSRAT